MRRAGIPIPPTYRRPPPGVIPPAPHVEQVPSGMAYERHLAADGKVLICGQVYAAGELDGEDEPAPAPRRVPRIF
jgi:hypothetical protein